MESKELKLNIKQELFRYVNHWRWVSVSVAVCLIACFFYLRYTRDYYQTSAKIQILDSGEAAFKLPSEGISLFAQQDVNLENQIEVMKSSRILGAVVDSLGLTTEIYSVGKIKSNELWTQLPFKVVWAMHEDSLAMAAASFNVTVAEKGYFLGEDPEIHPYGETNFEFPVPFKLLPVQKEIGRVKGREFQVILRPKNAVIKALARNMEVDYVGNRSDILKISFVGPNSEKLNAVVNELVDVFNQDGIRDRQQVFRKTIDFVDKRFAYLFRDLDSIEMKKADFKKRHQLSYIESDAGLSMGATQEAREKLDKGKAQLMLAGMVATTIDQSAPYELLPANLGLDNTEINRLIDEYNNANLLRRKLIDAGGGDSNPRVRELSNLSNRLKGNIKASLIGYQKTLSLNERELARINTVETSRYSSMPDSEKSLRSIERQQSLKENLYLLLLQKREEAAINLAVINPSIKVVDYAIYPSEPIGPQRGGLYLGSLLAGLLIPLGVIYIVRLFDTKIQSKEDLEKGLPGIPVIAEIPFIDSVKKTIEFQDRSVLSESFRMLRTNINYLKGVQAGGVSLFVTSTLKGEGKTFVSSNLAITLASMGKKVVLVGADLRNPQLHNTLGIERDDVTGLSSFLIDDSLPTKSLIKRADADADYVFDIIFSGAIPPNPAELLSNGRFGLLLADLQSQYDFVVVDTAPTLLVTDTTLISHHADIILYVTRANFTDRKLLKFISNLKEFNGLKNLGVVLNNVSADKTYGYGYSYNYGYGYGYDDSSARLSFFKRLKRR